MILMKGSITFVEIFFRFRNFLFIKSICTTFKSEKVNRAKLFLKYIDFTTLLVGAVYPKKWKKQEMKTEEKFWYKAYLFCAVIN